MAITIYTCEELTFRHSNPVRIIGSYIIKGSLGGLLLYSSSPNFRIFEWTDRASRRSCNRNWTAATHAPVGAHTIMSQTHREKKSTSASFVYISHLNYSIPRSHIRIFKHVTRCHKFVTRLGHTHTQNTSRSTHDRRLFSNMVVWGFGGNIFFGQHVTRLSLIRAQMPHSFEAHDEKMVSRRD